MRKRILSIVITVCIVLAMLPTSAITASAEGYSDDVTITGTRTDGIILNSVMTAVLDGCTINSEWGCLDIRGDVTLVIKGTVTLNSRSYLHAGIKVLSGNSVTIRGYEGTTNKLIVRGGNASNGGNGENGKSGSSSGGGAGGYGGNGGYGAGAAIGSNGGVFNSNPQYNQCYAGDPIGTVNIDSSNLTLDLQGGAGGSGGFGGGGGNTSDPGKSGGGGGGGGGGGFPAPAIGQGGANGMCGGNGGAGVSVSGAWGSVGGGGGGAAGFGYETGGGGNGGRGACYNWSGTNWVKSPWYSNLVSPTWWGSPGSSADSGCRAYIDDGNYAYAGQGGGATLTNGFFPGGEGGNSAVKKGLSGQNTYPNSVATTSYKTVCFNANGGSSNSYAMTTGNTVGTLPATNPTRQGYTFGGWNTNASGTGSAVSTSTTLSSTVNTYYAVWTRNTYKVVITVQKDSVPWTSAPSGNIVLSTAISNPMTGQITTTPSNGVFTFNGIDATTTMYVWAKNKAGNYAYRGIASASTTTFTVNYYDVTLTAGTGIQSVSGTGTYISGETATISAVLAPGYVWNNWSDGNTTMTGRTITVNAKTDLAANATLIPIYTISTDKTAIDFGSLSTGYTQPSAATVTVTNTGNQSITLTLPTSTNYIIGSLSKEALSAGETATFTIQPKANLAYGNHDEVITVSTGNGTSVAVSAKFTVTDNTAPTATISIGSNSWNSFLNTVTFGLFFKETKTVTVTANDTESGVKTIEYLLSTTKFDSTSSVAGTWTDITSAKQFNINSNSKQYIYVRVTDNDGNVSVINTDGIVLYTDSSDTAANITFTKTGTADKSTQVALNGNTVKEIKNNGNVITASNYTVAADGTITFKAFYLDSLAADYYTLTVSYNPLGEAYKESTVNTAPGATTIHLTVQKTDGAVTGISNISKTYDGNAVSAPTYNKLGTGTATIEYKVKGTADSTYTTTAPKNAGDYTVRVTVATDDNYKEASSTANFTIAQKQVTITGTTVDDTKVYDGNTTAKIKNAGTISDNYDGDNLTIKAGTAAYATKGVAQNKSVTFAGFALSGSKSSNYTLSAQPASVTANITPKPITISGITAKDKIYDGNKIATLVMPTVTPAMGVVTGDAITVNASGLFENINAGSNKTVNISGITLGGADVYNYMLAATGNQLTTTASINRKAIVVTPDALSKNVGQNDPSLSYTCSEPVTGETVSCSGALSRSPGETTGNYPLGLGTLALTNNGAFLKDNYYLLLSNTIVNFKINNVLATTSDYEVTGNEGAWNRTDLILTPKGDYVKVSTDRTNWNNSLILNIEGAASTADFYLKKTDGTITDKTTYTYKLDKTAPTGTLSIQTNSWTSFLNNITFGLFFKENVNVNFTTDADISGIAKTEFIKTETVYDESGIKTATGWADFSNTSITAADKDKFIYYIRLTDNAGNVSYISSEGITFDNTKPSITSDYQKGDSRVTFRVADETAGIASVQYTVDANPLQSAALDSNGQFIISNLADGKYDIVVKATDNAGNIYSFTQAITSRHTVKYMDGSTQLGETLTVDYGASLTKPTDPKKAGNIFSGWYKEDGLDTLWSFASDTVTANILIYAKFVPKQTSTASITQADVVYGTTVNPKVSCISTGEQTIEYKVKGADDTLYTTSKPTNVGEYTARVLVAESSIHLAINATADFKITPKELTVTGLAVNNKIYDGKRTASFSGTPTLSGIAYNDNITLINGAPSFIDENVGTAKAVSFTNFAISGTAASNYALKQPASTTANITAKTITVTPDTLSKNVGQTDPKLTYTCTGTISGETGSFVGTLSRTAGETAGIYPINLGTLALADNGAFKKANYQLELSATTVNFTIKTVLATTSDYKVTGNDGAWNNADLTIAPYGDYAQISTDRTNWNNYISLNTEGSASTVDFYLKKTDGTTTNKVTYTYKLDKTAPTGAISQGANNWTSFLNTITFGLFFKETQTVTITGADTNGSGVASTGYYVLEVDNNKDSFEVTLEQAKTYTYTAGTNFNINPEKNVIVFAKIVDNAGNVTYINSQGLVLEETAPVISGITDGETYYTTRKIIVSDTNLDKVTVNNEDLSGNTIAGDVDKTYTIVATDKAGNSTTYFVTMKTIASLSTAIDSLITNEVKSSDKSTIEAVKAAVSAVELTNATQAEKDKLKAIADKCDALLARISANASDIQAVTTKLGSTTKDNAKSSDSVRLEEVKTELERLLGTQNLTDAEKASLDEKLTATNQAIAEIAKVAGEISAVITKLGNTTTVNAKSRDNTRLAEVKAEFERLLGTQNLTDAEKATLEAKLATTNQAIAEIAKVAGELSAVTTKLGNTTKDNAKSSDNTRLAEVKAEFERLLGTQNLTDAEKASLDEKLTATNEAIAEIAKVAGEISAVTTKLGSTTKENAKSSDSTRLAEVKAQLERLLGTQNLTDNEKFVLEQKKADVENALVKIAEISEKITDASAKTDGITTNNVKSSYKANLDNALITITDLLATNNLTDSERAALEKNKTDAENALARIAEIAMNTTDAKDPVKDITKDNVTKKDRTKLEKAEEDLQNILENFANNLTDTEKVNIENQIKSIQDTTKVLDDVKAVEDLIEALPSSKDVTKSDVDDICDTNDSYSKLNDHQLSLIEPSLKEKLMDASNALKKLLLFDAPTGTKVEGVDGTELNIRTELVVKLITQTLDKTTMKKFAVGVSNAANNQKIALLYDVKLLLNGQPIQPDGKVKITLKLTNEQKNYEDLQVVHITNDGAVTIIPCEINGNEVSFITDHFSYYGIIGTPIKSSSIGKTTPNTGDNMPVIPYIVFAFLSTAALAITIKKRKLTVIKK